MSWYSKQYKLPYIAIEHETDKAYLLKFTWDRSFWIPKKAANKPMTYGSPTLDAQLTEGWMWVKGWMFKLNPALKKFLDKQTRKEMLKDQQYIAPTRHISDEHEYGWGHVADNW